MPGCLSHKHTHTHTHTHLVQSLAMALWPFFTDVNNYECIGYKRDTTNTVAPAAAPPQMYLPGQAIPMQPVVFAQQQVYSQAGVYPATVPYTSEEKTNLVSE